MGVRQPADAERAKRNHRTDGLVDQKAPRDYVDAAWNADRTTVVRSAFSGVTTALRPVARGSPWDQIQLLLQERIQVGIRGGCQGGAGIALRGGDRPPILARRPLEVII